MIQICTYLSSSTPVITQATTAPSTTATPTPTISELATQVDEVRQAAADIIQDHERIHEKLSKHDEVVRTVDDLKLPQTLKGYNDRLRKLERVNLDNLINEAIEEQVQEAVTYAMEAPLRSKFNDLPIVDMKLLL